MAKKLPKVVQASDRQIFNAAVSFHIRALRCGESKKTASGKVQSPAPPMIANFAFAIELYFKSLLVASNGMKKGHNLEDLFGRLRVSDREEIEKRFETLSGRNPQSLQHDIASYSGAFEEWRYIYESRRKTRIAVYSLSDLARACFFTISERNPDWSDEASKATISPNLKDAVVAIVSLGGGQMLRAVASD